MSEHIPFAASETSLRDGGGLWICGGTVGEGLVRRHGSLAGPTVPTPPPTEAAAIGPSGPTAARAPHGAVRSQLPQNQCHLCCLSRVHPSSVWHSMGLCAFRQSLGHLGCHPGAGAALRDCVSHRAGSCLHRPHAPMGQASSIIILNYSRILK